LACDVAEELEVDLVPHCRRRRPMRAHLAESKEHKQRADIRPIRSVGF
jgi:hypothetical protein